MRLKKQVMTRKEILLEYGALSKLRTHYHKIPKVEEEEEKKDVKEIKEMKEMRKTLT